MKNDWYDSFIDALCEKYPKKSQLAEALMDLLLIERESAYRRLRKQIMFTVHELVKISSAWNISLDGTVGTMLSKVSFQMHPVNFLMPSEEDMKYLRKRSREFEQLKEDSYSEYILVCNYVTRSLSTGFANLFKFDLFKWTYEYCNTSNEKSNMMFSDIVILESITQGAANYSKCMKYITNTTYILDSTVFENYIDDIRFFHSIFLITDEDKKLLKKELHALLDYLLDVANNGCFPETKKKVHLYISKLHINTNYSYFHSARREVCRIHSFNMYDNITYDVEMLGNFKQWLQKKKRTCILVSEADERSRIEFIMKQRELIDGL